MKNPPGITVYRDNIRVIIGPLPVGANDDNRRNAVLQLGVTHTYTHAHTRGLYTTYTLHHRAVLQFAWARPGETGGSFDRDRKRIDRIIFVVSPRVPNDVNKFTELIL